MPLLKREPELFPDELFLMSDRDLPWWVAHTLSRQDKALARHLFHLQVPFYLPYREHRTRRAGRTFVSYLPLFPGYVFFRGTAEQKLSALRSNLIVKILEVTDQALLAQELLQLRKLKESGAQLVPFVELVPGDPVCVREGPFKGYTGVVLRAQGRLRLLISISMLKQVVAVEFERDAIAPTRLHSPERQKDQSVVSRF
jgi:transcription antitermination factor NusG